METNHGRGTKHLTPANPDPQKGFQQTPWMPTNLNKLSLELKSKYQFLNNNNQNLINRNTTQDFVAKNKLIGDHEKRTVKPIQHHHRPNPK